MLCTPILEMRTLRPRGAKQIIPGHRTHKLWNQTQTQVPESVKVCVTVTPKVVFKACNDHIDSGTNQSELTLATAQGGVLEAPCSVRVIP